MEIYRIIASDFTIFCFLVGLSLLITTNKYFDKRSTGYFVALLFITLILTIADTIDYYLTSFDTVSNVRYLTSAIGYTLRPASIAIVLNILLRRKRNSIALWMPIFILGVIAFTSKYTHVMFYFNEANYFMRGPLSFLPHFVSALYMLMLIIKTIQENKYLDFSEIMIVFYIAFICSLATLLESLLPVKFLIPGAILISCTLYYLLLNIQTYKRDALTGLLNRKSLFADCTKWKNNSFAIISTDLNELKNINDTFGHKEGDNALRIFAQTLLSVAEKSYRLYRVGGR